MDLSRPRPGVRRKSSASNLLIQTLKPAAAASTQSTLSSASPTAASSIVSSVSSFNPSTVSSATSVSQHREWDGQSILSESSHSNTPPALGPNISPTAASLPTQAGQIASPDADLIRDMVAKRMKTFSFLKSVHEGKGHWLQSIQFSRHELDKEFDNSKMRRRTHRFHVLGMSLSSLWEIAAPNDFLRGLLTILDEFDHFQEDANYKPKMRNIFKSGSSKIPGRKNSAPEASTPPYSDFFTEGSILVTPSFPFPLDYSQTLFSLYDILLEIYHKIYRLLGPSILPSSHAPQPALRSVSNPVSSRTRSSSIPEESSGGMINLISPLPFEGQGFAESLSLALGSDALFELPIQGQGRQTQPVQTTLGLSYGPGLPPMPESPPPWSPVMGDTIIRIDSKIKKIWVPIVKELDALARDLIKQELALLSLGGGGGSLGLGTGVGDGWVDIDGQ